jgi:hypothetical protein
MSKAAFNWLGKQEQNPAHDMVAEFLVIDIQNSPEWAKELLDKIDDVQTGKLSQWERIGNAFCLELFPDKAIIEDIIDENREPQSLSLEEFSCAVLAWLELCHN